MYHKKNVDFVYLLWEDFVYQVEHKDDKKSNEMYYPQFTKVIINFFMTKDPSILRRNKFGAILPVELINKDIRNYAAYKEYYAIASGAAPPKTKASVMKTQSSLDTTMPRLTAIGTRLSTSAKGKQPSKSSKSKGLSVLFEKSRDEDDDDDDVDNQSDDEFHDDQEDEDDQDDNDDDQDSDNDDDDFVHPKLSTHNEEAKDKESFDHIVQTPSHVENSDDKGNDDESYGMNVGGDKGPDAEDDDEELYEDVNINLEGRDIQMTDVHTTQVLEDTHVTLTPVKPDGIDSIFESTPRVDVPVTTTVVPLLVTAPTLPPPFIPIISQVQQAPAPSPATAPSTSLQDFPNFGSLFGFDHSQAENEDFLNKLDENIQKIIKEQVKEQVKVQVSKILPKIEKTVNEQLKSKVLTRASNSSKTSYAMATDLSELELKKIQIEKIESNKSIYRLDEQRNLYKALVDAYECATDDQPILEDSQHPEWFKKQTKPPTPDRDWNKTLPATHRSIQTWISNLAKQADSRTLFNELMDTPVYFSAFLMNRLKVDTLTPELLAVHKATTDQVDWNNPEGQQYTHNLLKPLPLIPNSRGRRIIPFAHFINNHLDYLCGGASSRKYTTSVTKTKAADYEHIKWIEDLTIWRRSDKERAAAMIQAIDKQLKTRRIMRSLEKFVVDEGVLAEMTRTRTAVVGEIGLFTRRGSRVTKSTEDAKKGKIMLLIMHQLNVQGQLNKGQRNNARGTSATGYGGAQNIVGNTNPEFRILQRQDVANSSSGEWGCHWMKSSCFLLQAKECDVFDSDVDEASTAHTMFMTNLSFIDHVYDEAGPSYDSDILSEVHDHDNYQDVVCELHKVHEMHDHVQPNCVVDSNVEYTSDSNMITYDWYVKDNAESVVQNIVSSIPHDSPLMIINEIRKQTVQCVSVNAHTKLVDASLTAELAIYMEQVKLYERRAKFELTAREQKIEEQLIIVIIDRNIKEENLKKNFIL
nr:hypothetical protein [Tanacetum cinerariifolium]